MLYYSTIVEKLSDSNETVFRLELSTETLAINYLSASGAQTIEFGDNYIPPLAWTHIAIQVSAHMQASISYAKS